MNYITTQLPLDTWFPITTGNGYLYNSPVGRIVQWDKYGQPTIWITL